jgi:hypothetical protein
MHDVAQVFAVGQQPSERLAILGIEKLVRENVS